VVTPGGIGGGIGTKVYVNGSASGERSGPLQEVNALKYIVPLVNEDVIGIKVPIELLNI
jgi:hypothetical protein